MNYWGDFAAGATVNIYFSTNDGDGGRVEPNSAFEAADVRIYKDGSDTQRSSEAGYTMTSPFDSMVGIQHLSVDLSDNTDAGFYAAGSDYTVILYPDETVDSQNISHVVGQFSIDNRNATTLHATTDALIDGIGTAGGAAISTDVNDDNYDGGIAGVTSATVKVGTETNTYVSTSVLDGTAHIMTHAAQAVDIVYQFLGGGGTSPVSIVWTGLLNPNNDTLTFQVWNHVGVAWETVGTATGQSSTTAFITKNIVLYARHMGTSATELGKVYLRLVSAAAYNHILRTDQVYMTYAVTSRTVGYADGAIWVDTVSGIAGTEDYVNGTADHPVLTWADALTLSASLGIMRFHIINGSTITLSAASDGDTLIGQAWTLVLNGQSCSAGYFEGASSVTGTCTGATPPEFYGCMFGAATLPPSHLIDCGFMGTITAGSAGDFTLENCHSMVAGTATPVFDFGAAIANENMHFRHYSGGIEIQNFGKAGTDVMSLEGHGTLVLNANCAAAGTIAIRGHFDITDNVAGGFVAGGGVISDNARYDVQQINDEADQALTDWGKTGFSLANASIVAATFGAGAIDAAAIDAAAIDNATFAADVGSTAYATNIIALATRKALDDYDPPTDAEMDARTLLTADYFDPAVDVVAQVTLVVTTTTNTDMVAAAPTAAAITDAVWDEAIAGHAGAGSTGLALASATAPTAGAVADAVWDELSAAHVIAGSFGFFLDASISGVGGAMGSGADPCTLTLKTTGGAFVADAAVWITSDEAGTTVVAGTVYTNLVGETIALQLDAGVTLYRWARKAGMNFDSPAEFVVVAD